MDEIFHGLVTVDVNDNDAIQKIANIVQGAKAQFAEMRNMDVGQIGPDLTGPLSTNFGEIEQQIKKLQAMYRNAFAEVGKGKTNDGLRQQLREDYEGLDRVLQKAREVNAVLNAPPPPPRPRDANGRYISREEAERRAAEAKAQADADARARRSEAEEIRARSGADPAGYGRITQQEEVIRRLEARIEDMRARGVDETTLAKYRQTLGMPPEMDPETGLEKGKFRPRSRAELDEVARSSIPDAKSLEFDRLDINMRKAASAHERAAEALSNEYKTAEQAQAAEERYWSTLGTLNAASKALVDARAKAAARELAEEAASDLKAKALDDPRRELLGLPNREFLQQQKYDLDQPFARTKIQIEQDNVRMATQALDQKIKEVKTSDEYNALIERKRRLAAREVALQDQLDKLDDKDRRLARGDGGFRGGLLGMNKDDDGFGGNLAYQAGITLKYFALYSTFSALQRALEQIKENTEAYTLAINQLAIATHTSYEEARQLSEQYSAQAGQFGQGPIEATQMMAKYVRTYGNTEDSLQVGARVGSIVGTLEPKDHQENVQQDLIALAKAYGIGPGGSEHLLDQMLAVARHYGYESPGEILPGVAAVGDIGKESGYNPAQLASLIASVMQNTGVGSDAAAGDIKRFLGSQNDPGLVQMFQRFNIDPDHSLREKLSELSTKIAGLDPEEQGRVLTSAGNPRIAAAVVAAIRGIPDSATAEGKAEDSTGLAADAARRKLATLSGQLQQFGVELEQLYLQLGASGIGDVLGMALKTGIAFVDVLGNVVKAFNEMPTVLKDIIGLITLLVAANKATAFINGGTQLANTGFMAGLRPNGQSLIGGASGTAAARARAALAAGEDPVTLANAAPNSVKKGLAMAAGEDAAAIAASSAAAGTFADRVKAAGSGMKAAAVSAGSLVASLLPLAMIAYGLQLASESSANADQQQGAYNEGQGGINDLNNAMTTKNPDQLKAANERLKNARTELLKGNEGVANWIANTFNADRRNNREALVHQLDGQIKLSEDELKAALAEEARLNSSSNSSQYFGRNYASITRGVNLIQSRGLTAPATNKIIEDLLSQNGTVLQSALQPGEGEKGLADIVSYSMGRTANVSDPVEQTKQYGELGKILQRKRVEMAADLNRQRKALVDAQNLNKQGANLDLGEYESAVGNSETQLAALDGQLDTVNKAFTQSLVAVTRRKVDILKKSYSGTDSQHKIEATLQDAMIQLAEAGDVTALTQLMDGADKAFDEKVTNLLAIRESILESIQKSIDDALRIAEEKLGATPERANAKDEYYAERNARNARSNASRAAAVSDAAKKAADTAKAALQQTNPTGTDTEQPGRDLDIAKALEGATTGDPVSQAKAALAAAQIKLNAIKNHDTAEYYNALKEVNDQKRAVAEAEHTQAAAAAAAAVPAGDQMAAALAAVTATKADMDAAVYGTADYWNKYKANQDAQYNLAKLQRDVAAAQAAAAEIPGDPASAAKIAIAAATAAMANLKRDSVEYWSQVRALHQAQYDLAKIELQNASARDTLGIDITDPAKVAQARVREAERQLTFDKQRGAGADVLLQDEVALRQSRSDAQATAWNQEFQRQRTNYDLQRTSLSAYLSYLRAQHDYLSAVKNKTYEQTQELNQVDQALKSLTDSLQGQWNLGDIKVPTAYEMRRQLMGGAQANNVSYVTITMNGSSTAEMKAALQQAIGQPILQSVGTGTAKV